MISSTVRTGLLAAALGVLAIAAVAGWTRDPEPRPGSLFAPQPYQELAGYDVHGQPVYEQRGIYTSQPADIAPLAAQPAVLRQSAVRQPATPPPAAVESASSVPIRPAVKPKRSTKKSVAIVAGSAGTGAAIGAIAGGGKGAAIGAISGGAAGFIYDRITHDR